MTVSSDGDGDAESSVSPSEAELLGEVARAPSCVPASTLIGAMVGRYRIVEVLGQGGMGVVYEAEDTQLRRRVALKVLLPESVQEPRRRSRFLREGRSAARATHPHIAAVFDVGESDGHVFIAMELVEGRSLRALLDDHRGGLPLPLLASVGRQIATALAHAHEAGVVHRDLKPENVMLGAGGIKILDFGVAKVLDDAALHAPNGTAATAEGSVLGTPSYMSPEQAKGRDVDHRTDIFSFGVLMFELASGSRPFLGDTSLEVAIAIDRDPAPPLSSLRPDAPESLAKVIDRCLQKRPSDRHASCRDVVKALDGLEERTSPRALGSRGKRAMVAVVLGLALAIGVGAWLRPARPQVTTPTAASPPAIERAVALTDLPVPVALADAATAYRAAIQAERDGSLLQAIPLFEEAIRLDPGFAQAHLRLALRYQLGELTLTGGKAQQAFNAAYQLRDKLDERDRGLLDALEPTIVRQPMDHAETVRRLRTLVERFPRDADLRMQLAMPLARGGALDAAIASFDEALRLDPRFGSAIALRAFFLAYRGQLDLATDALDACRASLPGSQGCTQVRWSVEEATGRCDALLADAQRFVAETPTERGGYRRIAQGLIATGEPLEAAEVALAQGWALTPEPRREAEEAKDRLALDLLRGDFASAKRRAEALAASVVGDRHLVTHAYPARALVAAAEETQDSEGASKVATDFLRRKSGWAPVSVLTDFGVAIDPTVEMLATARRAGRISSESFEEERARWEREQRAAVGPFWDRYVWPHGHAAVVRTPEEARSAMAALPSVDELPAMIPLALVEADVGRTFLLAGDGAHAVTWLRRAVGSCRAFNFPVQHVRAELDLGTALENAGDIEGACARYGAVLSRWGQAKPRSVTAERARARAAKLRCAHPR